MPNWSRWTATTTCTRGRLPPTIAVARLMNSLKGGSARRLRQRYRVRTHREHPWSPSYFAASTVGAPPETVKAYIRQQRTRAARVNPLNGGAAPGRSWSGGWGQAAAAANLEQGEGAGD
jgi:hypothetical protein